jgi:hypothetical protein
VGFQILGMLYGINRSAVSRKQKLEGARGALER